MLRRPWHQSASSVTRLTGVALALSLTGCAMQPPTGSGAVPPEAPLHLVAAGQLELPEACEPRAGAVYRVNFVVQGDGRVAQIEPGADTGCVHDALRAWVGTFEYRPPGTPVAAVLDWLGVTAARLR